MRPLRRFLKDRGLVRALHASPLQCSYPSERPAVVRESVALDLVEKRAVGVGGWPALAGGQLERTFQQAPEPGVVGLGHTRAGDGRPKGQGGAAKNRLIKARELPEL